MIAGRLRPLRVPALVLALLATLVSARPVWGADPITVRSATLANVQSGRCLEIFEFNATDNAWISQWSCWGGKNQRWGIVSFPTLDKRVLIRNEHGQKCLEWDSNYRDLLQHDCDYSRQRNQQTWNLEVVSGDPNTVNGSEVVFTNAAFWYGPPCLENYRSLNNDGNLADVSFDSCARAPNQRWRWWW